MAEQKFSIERDVKEAQAMAAALVPYVYEDELYGRIGMNMPSLTIGALLMRKSFAGISSGQHYKFAL